ncbi:diguanylate cyclase [Acidihalobacter aeolianus]|uniref:cyclic-guanylate-specific phosphodiesterase n=2 Tax=Acidihalobacter aeolianus TaxID=2792603 RepID=A0A1D8KBK3_9GAMM|nr:diguanylate cyclase [Acidihalobacter aeolianus]
MIRVGVYENPPKIFIENGRISGIFGDLLYAIADREGWQVQPVACTWRKCLQELREGKIDLMPDVTYNEERARFLDFGSIPALHGWSELYRNPHVMIVTVHDLVGKRIGVLADSSQERYLRQMLHDFGVRKAGIVPLDSLDQAFAQAAQGNIDAVATNYFFGDIAARRYGLKATPIIFQPSQLYFAVPKGTNRDLLEAIDFYLGQWITTPESPYYRILEHWKAAVGETHIPASVWWSVGLLNLLLVLALVTMWLQRRQVLAQGRHLQITEAKLAVILDSVDACIFIKDEDLRYQYVNHRQTLRLDRDSEAILGQTDDALFDSETAERMHTEDQHVLVSGETLTIEEQGTGNPRATGRTYLTVKQPLRDERGRIYALCGISTDFTAHKRAQEKIHQLAFYDPLTGLPNRALLLDRARHALDDYARERSLGALLFIDLDNFKVLNDTLGHAHGDRLLELVAARLGALVRRNDTLARLGGDEFVLLMERLGSDLDAAIARTEGVARQLLDSFADPFLLNGNRHNITTSIGAALFSEVGNRVDELLKRADMAMYEAKAAGRNQVKFFDPLMQASLSARAALETELREAITHRHFLLYYQPQVDASGLLIGAEALLRWEHPHKGLITPGRFIAEAESSGLIIAIGQWILRTACEQLVTWSQQPGYADLPLSVNVSARQFHHPDFVADVLHILKETGANPERLGLELTETLLAEDMDTLIEKMKALRTHGIRFSLDDFGTGYSSLSYLKRLPLDQLKIDQSFVQDLLDDPNDATIVKTILALGSSLDLEVIAEGVETAAQRDALLTFGCHCFQGYFFGHPGPAEKLPSTLDP